MGGTMRATGAAGSMAALRRAATALAACAAIAGCGGGSGSGSEPPPEPPAAPAESLVTAGADALLKHYRDRLRATSSGGATDVAAGGTGAAAGGTGAAPPTSPAATPAPASGALASTTAGASSTVLQESGVDEDDVVRVDGDVVWALTPQAGGAAQRLTASRVADGGAGLVPLGALELDPSFRFDGLYVDAPRRRVVAVGRRWGGGTPVPMIGAPVPAMAMPVQLDDASTIVVVDASDPARPSVARRIELGGSLQATRVVAGRLWVVLRSLPRFDGFDWGWAVPASNERWLAALTPDRLLPTWRVDGATASPLVDADACWLQPAAPGGAAPLTTIAAIDLAAPDARPLARCVATSVDTVYMTTDALYLTVTRWPTIVATPVPGGVTPLPATPVAPTPGTAPSGSTGSGTAGSGTASPGTSAVSVVPSGPVTDVHRFVLSPSSIAYRGSGSASGRLGNGADTARFMLSADGPRLRIVTQRDAFGAAAATGPALLTVLEDAGAGALKTVSTLPNARRPEPIGKPGEQVHGVRFVGARAYVVTFRRIDPVYVLDLADPADPKVLGALEVPGFSDRLYPLTDTLLLGVGHDSVSWNGMDLQTGVLVSLIDVGDPARPVERARRTIGGRGSHSASDASPHGTMIRAVGGGFRIALPVTVHDGPAWPSSGMPDPALWRGFGRVAAIRFTVDPAAPALVERAPVTAATVDASGSGASRTRTGDGSFDRAVDVGDTTWLWVDGRFTGAPW